MNIRPARSNSVYSSDTSSAKSISLGVASEDKQTRNLVSFTQPKIYQGDIQSLYRLTQLFFDTVAVISWKKIIGELFLKDLRDKSAITVFEVKFGAKILPAYNPLDIKVKKQLQL